MSENIELLYPIYLDIPMMISFVATMDGGYSLERVWKESNNKSGEMSGSVEGDAGLPSFISSLVKANIKALGNLDGKLSNSVESQIVFKHTEASLFMRLRHELLHQKRLKMLDEYKESEWGSIPLSSIVEISGEIHRSPINEIAHLSKRFIPFLTQSLPFNKEGNVDMGNLSPEQKELLKSITAMQGIATDLESSPLFDAILKQKGNGEKTAVLDIATKNLSLMEQEILHCGRVTIMGKVTRVLAKQGDKINLYRRSVLGIAAESLYEQITKGLNSTPNINMKLESPTVEYPAVEIVPMAIYI